MSLDLALIGNGTIAALIDPAGEIKWGCFPRLDGDPAFCSLLNGRAEDRGDEFGMFAVDLVDAVRTEQEYLVNTPILVTRVYDAEGGVIELTDFAPRFRQYSRMFCPMMLVRQVRRLSGNPRVRIRLRPARDYGCERPRTTTGSNHIRYYGGDVVLRLTTDASTTAVLDETPFYLEDSVTMLLGPDETVDGAVSEIGRHFLDETASHWREWVRMLAIPFEWQDAVIRAAITLQLNVFEDTGAIVAAVTTSIPEAPNTVRNWDYRYCWIRDAYFVVNALNRLGATRTMERYLSFILNIVAGAEDGRLKPLYGINGCSIQRNASQGTAGWARCASAIKRTARCSTTSTGRRYSPRPTSSSTAAWPGVETTRSIRDSRLSASRQRACSTSLTPESGSFAASCAFTRSPA